MTHGAEDLRIIKGELILQVIHGKVLECCRAAFLLLVSSECLFVILMSVYKRIKSSAPQLEPQKFDTS